MPRVCVFCGGTPTTREHVYPAWLRDDLPEGAKRFKVTDASGQPLWEQRTFDIEARVVCGRCNSGWMSDLEATCGPFLSDPILFGSDMELNAKRQRHLALWAIKTTIVIEASRKDDVFKHLPEWHARLMPKTRDSGERADPPPGVSVVIFGRRLDVTTDGIAHFVASRSVGIAQRKPPHDSVGYVATLLVGHVGLQVFGLNIRASGLPSVWYSQWVAERTTALWPSAADTVTWPPALVMSTAEALQFADLWSDEP